MKSKLIPTILFIISLIISFVLGGLYFDNYAQSFIGGNRISNSFGDDSLKMVYTFLQNNYLYPNAIDSSNIQLGAIKGLVETLDDPYTVYLSPKEYQEFESNLEGTFEGIGAELGLRDGQLIIVTPIEGTPASKAGILPGDAIIRIDGESTEGLIVETAVTKIRGEKGTVVRLDIKRDNETDIRTVAITREVIDIPNIKTEIRDNTIGVVSISQFEANTVTDLDNAITDLSKKGVTKIILDLRYNPGGYLQSAVDMVELFVSKGELVVTEKGRDGKVIEELKTRKNPKYPDIPITILINEGSASASEIVAGALRDIKETQLIGKKSFGKGVVQSIKDFPDGSVLKYTIAEWLTPSGNAINKQGLNPDIEVDITADNIQAGQDPQLDKAVEYMKTL